jgi:hypothetical protein
VNVCSVIAADCGAGFLSSLSFHASPVAFLLKRTYAKISKAQEPGFRVACAIMGKLFRDFVGQ